MVQVPLPPRVQPRHRIHSISNSIPSIVAAINKDYLSFRPDQTSLPANASMNTNDVGMGSDPMTIQALSDKAKKFDWNPRIGFKYWARAAETIHHEVRACTPYSPDTHQLIFLLHQGQVYLREGNLPQAYLVLFRYCTLVLEYLPKHPEAKEPEARKALRPLQKRMPRVMEALETLRPEIEDSYDQWKALSAHRDTARSVSLESSSPYARHAANDPALSWSYKSPASILDASDYQDLAVDLAKKEMHRRKRSAGVWDPEEVRRRGAEYWDDKNKLHDRQRESKYMDDDELRRQMEATRRHLDRSDEYQRDYEDYAEPIRPAAYSYPSINKSAPLSYERPAPAKRVEGPRPQPPRPPKDRPPKERYLDRAPLAPLIPPLRPEAEVRLEQPSPIRPPPRPEKGPPLSPSLSVSSSTAVASYSPVSEELPRPPPKLLAEPAKQKRVTFRPAAYLENNEPIRPVFLPSTLRQRFLQIASDNTRKNLEMCGMLCGTTVNNALFISHLVIPQQKCTSDTCETENESVMLDFCIENDLIVIGWIHTHPTQTCFMSSRDLHTQAGYQVMMPESIAIVCAPRHEPS